MVDGIEVCLPIVIMFARVKVAGPDVHVLENGSGVNLLKQK